MVATLFRDILSTGGTKSGPTGKSQELTKQDVIETTLPHISTQTTLFLSLIPGKEGEGNGSNSAEQQWF